MYKKTLFLITLIALMIQGCEQTGFKETDSGLRYKFVKRGDGESPQDGNVILMNISYSDENGNVLFSTANTGQGAVPMSYTDSLFARNGGLEEGIRMMRRGDSLTLKFPIEDLFENTFNMNLPDTLRRGSDITIHLGASRILTMEEYQAYSSEQRFKQQERAKAQADAQFETDNKLLEDYLDQEGIETQVHPSGLRYRILKKGNGPVPDTGQQVHVNYTGRLLNGQVFDTSVEEIAREEGIYDARRAPYEPYTFELGTQNIIPGWNIGIGLLNQGSEAELFIPSKLAYGPRQMGPYISPNSILVFEVELVSIGD